MTFINEGNVSTNEKKFKVSDFIAVPEITQEELFE